MEKLTEYEIELVVTALSAYLSNYNVSDKEIESSLEIVRKISK